MWNAVGVVFGVLPTPWPTKGPCDDRYSCPKRVAAQFRTCGRDGGPPQQNPVIHNLALID